MEDSSSHNMRLAAFEWLQQVAPAKDYVLDWNDLTRGFQYNEKPIVLIGPRGIWKPKQIKQYPISITSVHSSIYTDKFVDDSTLHYSYRGEDPKHPDNIGLRNAMRDKVPLIYFHQILKGRYFVAWPVFIIGDEPDKLRFTVAAESNSVLIGENVVEEPVVEYSRRYQTREVLTRLHQSTFREHVLRAYRDHCAICKLKHRVLLDAAHIIPDREQWGDPIVPNGISLCKIHHAAYDNSIIGISPDYEINVREDILKEIDGPMLKYGIQNLNKQNLILPRNEVNWPDQERLDIRYQQFLKTG